MDNAKDMRQKYNLHTHTYRSKHGEGDAEDYARAAIDSGLTLLGFTEHPPLKPEGIWTAYRMDEDSLDSYFSAVQDAKERFSEIEILTGFEMDLYPRFKGYYEDRILHRKEIDFLVGGVHWFRYRGEWLTISEADSPGRLRAYTDEMVSMMESGILAFITHPDGYCAGCRGWDKNAEACAHDILSAAEEYRIPLEINGYGLRKKMIETPQGPRPPYPHPDFWKKASAYDITVVCNSDAHRPEDTAAGRDEGGRIITENGLTRHEVSRDLLRFSSENRGLNQPSLLEVP